MHAAEGSLGNNQINSLTCQALPMLTVTYVSFPRRWIANGTSSVMYPSALYGANKAIIPPAISPYPPLYIRKWHHHANSRSL
jgi:hypothetical protein